MKGEKKLKGGRNFPTYENIHKPPEHSDFANIKTFQINDNQNIEILDSFLNIFVLNHDGNIILLSDKLSSYNNQLEIIKKLYTNNLNSDNEKTYDNDRYQLKQNIHTDIETDDVIKLIYIYDAKNNTRSSDYKVTEEKHIIYINAFCKTLNQYNKVL
jgi:hypothetical protein